MIIICCLFTAVVILIGSTNANYNNQLDWSLSPSLSFFIPSLSHAQHPSSLVPYCFHLLRGGLNIWGFRDNRSAVDVQAMERIVLVSTICSFSTGAVGPPKRFQPHRAPPTTVPRVNWTTMNYMLWRSSATERMIGIGEWRRLKEFPKGALKTVSSGTMGVLSSLFIDNSAHIHCAARVVDLNSLAPLIIIIIIYSLLRCPRQNSHDVDRLGFNKFKKSLIEYLAAVCPEELNAEKEAPAITVACEETA